MSVVIAAYQVADYLAETLESVLAQDGIALEVVIVDDGSTDATGSIADAFAARDPRVRVLHQANAGLGAARNAGIAAATGEYLTFCDADDVLPAGAYAALTGSLLRSGSDLAIGRVVRYDSQRRWEPVWIDEVHSGAPRRGLTIDEYPVAIKNILECNRMYRRSAWDAIGPFPEGGYSEGYAPMVASFLGGRTFDLLDENVYCWRVREDGTSSTQQKARTASLRDRLAAVDVAAGHVAAHDSAIVTSAWHARVLELDLSGYYRFAPHADDEFRLLLAAAARDFLGRADARALRLVSVHRKVSAWLAAGEHWDALEWLEDRDGILSLRRLGRLDGGWPVADANQLKERFDLRPPRDVLTLSEYDTSLRAAVTGVTFRDETVEVAFDAWLRGVKRPVGLDDVSLELRLAKDPEHPPLRVVATHRGRHARAVVDVAELRAWAGLPQARVVLHARITWGDVERTEVLTVRRKNLPVVGATKNLGTRLRKHRPVVLRVRSPRQAPRPAPSTPGAREPFVRRVLRRIPVLRRLRGR